MRSATMKITEFLDRRAARPAFLETRVSRAQPRDTYQEEEEPGLRIIVGLKLR